MKHKTLFIALALGALVALLSLSHTPIAANPADGYTIDWYTIDGGGTMSASGGTFTLTGTMAQADAGTLSGGTYTLNGGFWGIADTLSRLLLPLILR